MSSSTQDVRSTHKTEHAEIVLLGDASRHGVVGFNQEGRDLNLVREPYFHLNVYRFMDKGRLMAIARDQPFQTEHAPSGMTLRWQATQEHPAELTAEYRVSDPATVDVHLTSQTLEPLQGYEVYLSSYFDFSMDPYMVIPSLPGKEDDGDQILLKVCHNPLINRYYVVFPRDAQAAALRFDGRWINPDTGKIIAHWVTGPVFSHPIVLMARADEYVVQMVDPDSCIGIGTTYSGDPDDNIVKHNALYLSLFGRDTDTGTRQTARIRQILCSGKPTVDELLHLYHEFLKSA